MIDPQIVEKGVFFLGNLFYWIKKHKKGLVLVDWSERRFAFRGALAEPPRRKRLRGLAWNADEAAEKVQEFFKKTFS
jgi:hypothetical protein